MSARKTFYVPRALESRFLTAEEVFGLSKSDVWHFSVSPPKELYDVPYGKMFEASVGALGRRGLFDGCSVIHPFRKDRLRQELVKSFHFHCLCYVEGGYRCLGCSKFVNGVCLDLSCDGFEALTRRAYNDDGFIVSLARNELGVAEKRKSIYGTAWYVTEHSGYKVGERRFQIVRWFGRLAKRQFKTKLIPKQCFCAICKGECYPSDLPNGVRVVANRGEKGFLKNFTLPHVDDDDMWR